MQKETGYHNGPGPESGYIIDTADSKDDEPDTTQGASASLSNAEVLRSDIELLDMRAYEEVTNPKPTL